MNRSNERKRWLRHAARLGTVAAVLFASLGAPPLCGDSIPGDDALAQYFEGLRARRLFALAESYCLQRLARGRLTRELRVEFTIELARTLSEHAAHAPAGQQEALWGQARTVLAEFLEKEPEHPRRILIEVQQALVPAEEGDWLRWIAELRPHDDETARQAAAVLNDAIAKLSALETTVAERTRKGAAQRVAEGALRPFEWRALGLSLRQRLGMTYLSLAHVLRADSAERAAAVAEAQRALKGLPETQEDDDSAWTSRIALVEAAILARDAPRALRELAAYEKLDPPRPVADRLLARQVRALMALAKFAEATAVIDVRERAPEPVPGELLFLRVALAAAQFRATGPFGGVETVADLAELLAERVARVRREAAGYWADRAELVLEQIRDEQTYGAELAALFRRAEARYRHGRLPAAVEDFGKAAALAHKQGRSDLAWQMGFTRGSVEIEARDWPAAAADLRELVEQFPQHPRAGEAHLLYAYALGRHYEEQPTRPRRQEYAEALEQHRARYTDPATLGEATWMLAGLYERRGQITQALKLFREITWDHVRGPAAHAAVARCYEKILERLKTLREPADEWEREAVTVIGQALPSAADEGDALDLSHAETAVRFARILLRRHPPDYALADRWLLRVLATLARTAAPDGASEDDAVASLRTQALQARIVSLAGQGQFQEARRQLEGLSTGSPAELLRILEGLAPLVPDDVRDPLHDLGELQLQAALQLAEQRDRLDRAQQRRLDECLARGYAATEKPGRAIEIYEALLADAPGDKRLLAEWIALLFRCGDKPCLRRALEAGRKLEALETQGTEAWLEARLQVCRCLLMLGERGEACKLLKVTRLLYPRLGSERLKARLAELESKCPPQK